MTTPPDLPPRTPAHVTTFPPCEELPGRQIREESPGRQFMGRLGTTFKVGLIGLLTLILLIPLSQIKSLLSERMERRNAVVTEISANWGLPQEIIGPVLIVPYHKQVTVSRNRTVNGHQERYDVEETVTANAYFLPDTLTINGNLAPERRYRGIYQAVVYRGALTVSGQFAHPDFTDLKIPSEEIDWGNAMLSFAIADPRGITDAPKLTFGTVNCPLLPGCRLPGRNAGITARVPLTAAAEAAMTPFTLELKLNGSTGIRFAPLGKQTSSTLQSAWPDPSFVGQPPTEHTITPERFEASWEASYYGRNLPQQWTDDNHCDNAQINQALFGVDLISPVDNYRFVERAIKYGMLFIVLAFTTFFLFEIMAKVRIHPFQYTLVGAALCLFYLALLSLSEVTGFNWAYLIGATAATATISFYCTGVLRSQKRGLLIGGGLAVVYGFLFIVLQLQDYSLIAGTIGLFLFLFLLMLATRRIDWYAHDAAKA